MPEKLLYFTLIEGVVLWAWSKKEQWPLWGRAVVVLVVVVLFVLSISYSLSRYNKRFWSYQYVRTLGNKKKHAALKQRGGPSEKYEPLAIPRAAGIWVPADQAADLTALETFINQNTTPNDTVIMFPELGMYNFLFDRPFLGRFPITTFSWFNDRWFEEYLDLFSTAQAKYIIYQKKLPPDWYGVYLGYPPNKEKYERMLAAIDRSYKVIGETPATLIYAHK